MSDLLQKQNSVSYSERNASQIQSFTNTQGGNATIIQVGSGGQQKSETHMNSTTIRKELIINEQLSDPSYNESSLLLEKKVSPEIINKTTIIKGESHEFRGDEEENYQKALILSGGVSHFRNCANIETCQDPSHLISIGDKMHRETRETTILSGMAGASQTYSNLENKIIRMESVELGRGQVTTNAQNQNSAMIGGQTVYVGGGGSGVYRENVTYAAGSENFPLVRVGGGGGMAAGYQTFQPMSVATASTNFKSHGGAGVVIAGGECKLTPALCALLLCNIVFWAIVLMLLFKEI